MMKFEWRGSTGPDEHGGTAIFSHLGHSVHLQLPAFGDAFALAQLIAAAEEDARSETRARLVAQIREMIL